MWFQQVLAAAEESPQTITWLLSHHFNHSCLALIPNRLEKRTGGHQVSAPAPGATRCARVFSQHRGAWRLAV